jgi:hypothetical protein
VFRRLLRKSLTEYDYELSDARHEIDRLIDACIDPEDIACGAEELLRLSINLDDRDAVKAALILNAPYKNEEVAERYISHCISTARMPPEEHRWKGPLPEKAEVAEIIEDRIKRWPGERRRVQLPDIPDDGLPF